MHHLACRGTFVYSYIYMHHIVCTYLNCTVFVCFMLPSPVLCIRYASFAFLEFNPCVMCRLPVGSSLWRGYAHGQQRSHQCWLLRRGGRRQQRGCRLRRRGLVGIHRRRCGLYCHCLRDGRSHVSTPPVISFCASHFCCLSILTLCLVTRGLCIAFTDYEFHLENPYISYHHSTKLTFGSLIDVFLFIYLKWSSVYQPCLCLRMFIMWLCDCSQPSLHFGAVYSM